MTMPRRRRESIEQEREREHDEDEKRLTSEAVGSGYFFSPTQQVIELEPRVVVRSYIDWRGTTIEQSVLLRRYEVRGITYVEHPGMLTGKRIKIKTVQHERELGAWRRGYKKNGGAK